MSCFVTLRVRACCTDEDTGGLLRLKRFLVPCVFRVRVHVCVYVDAIHTRTRGGCFPFCLRWRDRHSRQTNRQTERETPGYSTACENPNFVWSRKKAVVFLSSSDRFPLLLAHLFLKGFSSDWWKTPGPDRPVTYINHDTPSRVVARL